MSTRSAFALALAAMLTAGMAIPAQGQLPTYENTTFIPHQITTPDKVDTPIGTLEFFDGVPMATLPSWSTTTSTVPARCRYSSTCPPVSVYHLRQGQRDIGLTESHQILIAEELGDSKPLVLTWNNTSLYTWGFLDPRAGSSSSGRMDRSSPGSMGPGGQASWSWWNSDWTIGNPEKELKK